MKKLLVFSLISLMFVSSFALKVVMVTDVGGLGDKSFNDGTWAGVQMAMEQLPNVEGEIIISKEQTDYIPNLTNAAQRGDVVIGVGFMMADALFNIAAQYPDTFFIGIDIEPSPGQTIPNNLALYTFKEHEAGFLGGYVAAAMTKTGKIGFVGGLEIPPVKRYEIGYRAGVEAYNQIHGTNVQVLIGYAASFEDPAKGKQLTLSQYDNGADIVFACAGATGNGVIDAVKETGMSFYGLPADAPLQQVIDKYYEKGEGYFAIGVDVDQDYMAPGYVLLSITKKIDVATFEGINSALSARYFQAGHNNLGIVDDGVGISPMKYTKGLIPNEVIAELAYLQSLAKEGKINIPQNEAELGSFNASNIVFPF
jgi:basic membrane protein A